jgi:hypothetical protein
MANFMAGSGKGYGGNDKAWAQKNTHKKTRAKAGFSAAGEISRRGS